MITRLDRYVGRMFVASWVVSVVFFVGLFGVYDFFGHIDDLMEQLGGDGNLGVLDVFELYACQVPSILLKVAPFVMVMAALVSVMRLQRHNEFMAMVLIGRSPRRVLRPVIVLTAVFVLGLVYVQESVAPQVAGTRDELRAALIDGGKERLVDVQTKDSEGKLFVARDYNVNSRVITLLNVSYSDSTRRDVVISGENAIWDEVSGGWLLENGRSVVTRRDQPPAEGPAPFVRTDLRPEDLMISILGEFDLPYSRILERSERYPAKRSYRMLRHYHVTFPLSVLLLVLLVLPFVVRGSPRARLRGLGLALLCSLGFFVLDTGARQLGTDGQLQPVVAAWLPVILLGSVIVVMHDTAEG